MSDGGPVIYERPPPAGTNWSCAVIEELQAEARRLIHIKCELQGAATRYEWSGFALQVGAALLALLNVVSSSLIVRVLLLFFVGLLIMVSPVNRALVHYGTAAELTDVIDAIRDELWLDERERIDGIVFLRTVQSDRAAILEEYRNATVY
jgi:hypothetical protein